MILSFQPPRTIQRGSESKADVGDDEKKPLIGQLLIVLVPCAGKHL